MKFIKKILFIALLIVTALCIYALFLPSDRTIERSLVIKAPASKIYTQVVDFKNWEKWSPWASGDSTMKAEFSGADKGVGAEMSWTSENSGNGMMKILEVKENEMVKIEYHHEKEDTMISYWHFSNLGDSTKATKTMEMQGLGYPLGRLAGYFTSGMIENSYNDELKRLAFLVTDTNSQTIDFECGIIMEKSIEAQPALAIKTMATMENISQKLGEIYGKVAQYLKNNNIQVAGPPFSIYYSNDPQATEWEMAAGFPIASETKGEGEIIYQPLHGGEVLTITHCGGYENLGESYTKIFEQLYAKGFVQNGASWESYLTDPQTETDTSKWVTSIYLPVSQSNK